MGYFSSDYLYTVGHVHETHFCFDRSVVSDLSAAFSVERRSVKEYGNLVSGRSNVCDLVVDYKGDDLSVRNGLCVIACELRNHGRIKTVVYGLVGSHICVDLSGGPRSFLLELHLVFESVLVKAQALLLKNFFRKVDGESVGIVELEGFFSVHNGLSRGFHFVDVCLKEFHSLVDCLVEAVFFHSYYFINIILFFNKLGISVA